MRVTRIAVLLAALGAALLIFGGLIRAADANLPIYFPASKLIVKAETFNRETYLPLKEILESMGVPYTDALALETLTIRSGNARLVVTKNSALISYNDQIVLLPSPVLREDSRWLVPMEFLTLGLTRLTGTEFRYRPGTPRIFAENVDAPELVADRRSGAWSGAGARRGVGHPAARIHGVSSIICASSHIGAKHKAVIVTTDKGKVVGATANWHRAPVNAVCSVQAQIILHCRSKSAGADRSDDPRVASAHVG